MDQKTKIPLICHRRGDGDIARAFLEYYSKDVSEFHFILHGTTEDNREIWSLSANFPITIHCVYDTPYNEDEMARRLNELVSGFMGKWIFLVDSDEFLELPHLSVSETIRTLEGSGLSCMGAPLLQRLRFDGSLESPATVQNPFAEFPLCSERLCELMGSTAFSEKYPLFRCGPETSIGHGHHIPPNGVHSANSAFRGVTHHFKWRKHVIERINSMIEIGWPWAEAESAAYLKYFRKHNFRLPLNETFIYSRGELIRRGLLRKPVSPIGVYLKTLLLRMARRSLRPS